MLPVLQQPLLSTRIYTTRLQAGLGLLNETARLLELWHPGMSSQDLLRDALSTGSFPAISARRLRNVVTEAFAPRYLVDDGLPARLLKTLKDRISSAELRQLQLLYTCRANAVLADFIRDVYWSRYASGGDTVTLDDARQFVLRAVGRGLTTTVWADSTVTRVSNYLLGTCADFGLLASSRGKARQIVPMSTSVVTSGILAYDLHFRGIGDNAILSHADWSIFGLEREDVLVELKRLALRGALVVQSSGNATHIGWKANSLEEAADVLAHS